MKTGVMKKKNYIISMILKSYSIIKKTLASLFLIFSLLNTINGQNYKFRHLGEDEGLHQSNVTSIIQDSIGFLWFGTEDGLYKYDGYNLKVFLSNPSDNYSLTDNFITTLLEDGNDIWIGTKNGLNKYSKQKNTFSRYLHNELDNNSINDNIIHKLIKDNNNRIWCGTEALNLYSRDNNNFIRIALPYNKSDPLTVPYVNSISEDSKGFLWISASNGLYKFDPANFEYLPFPFDKKLNEGFDSQSYYYFLEDSKQNYWIGSQTNGLFHIDNSKNKLYHFKHDPLNVYSISGNMINDIMIDVDNNLWISTTTGLSLLKS